MGLLDSLKKKAKEYLGVGEPGLGKLGELFKKDEPKMVFKVGEGLDKETVLRPGPTRALADLPKEEPVRFSTTEQQKIAPSVIAKEIVKKDVIPVGKSLDLKTIKTVAQKASSLLSPGGLFKEVTTTAKGQNLAADIARATPRALTSIGLEPTAGLLSLIQKRNVEPIFTPKTALEKKVFGEEPIKGIFKETKEVQNTVKNYLVSKGFNPDYASGMSLAIAPIFIGSMKGLDILPVGGEGKAVKKGGKLVAEKVAKVKPKEIFEATKDVVYKGLQSLRKGGIKVPFEYFDEAENLITKIEKGKATMNDLNKGYEIIRLSELKISPTVSKEIQPLYVDEIADKYFYHGTNEYILDEIVKKGLKPMRIDGNLSVSKTEKYAKQFARSGMTPKGKTDAVLLRVNKDFLKGKTVSSTKPRPATDELYEVLTKETIPPESLEIKKDGRWVSLLNYWNKANKRPSELLGLGAGVEFDEEGKMKFSPEKAALGFLGVKGVKKLPGNLKKLNVSNEVKQGLKETISQIKPELQKIKGGVLKNKEVLEAAKRSDLLRRISTKEATIKSEAALLRTRQHLAELAKTKEITPEFLETLKVVSAEATKRGRELQALGIKADPSLGSIKTKLVKELLKIGKSTDEILEASKGIDFTNAKQVEQFYRKFVKPTLPELLDEYRYINLLSSPRTHIVNAFSNLLQVGVLRPLTRLASGTIDNIGSKLTGKEQQYYLRQVPAYYKGAINSFGDAVGGFLKALKGESIIYRPDVKQIPTGNKFLRPFQIVPRMLEGSDVFFRTLASGGELEALMSRGIPEAQAIERAARTAEELVFRKALDASNKTGQGIVLSSIDKMTNAVYKLRNVPGVKWFVPFVQTPMNILKQGIEYSPLGVTTLVKNTNKTEQLAKAMVGSTVFGGAAWLALQDRTTWGAPTNRKEKDAFYAAGMQPYSVKIGDKWVSYSKLGPLAYPMAMAAALKYYTKEDPKAVTDTELEKITKIIRGISEFFADQSYVSGLGDFVDMAKGDTTALTRAASNIPTQLIPLSSLQRWVANIIDPVYRKTDTKLSVNGIINNLKKGIPFASKTVEPYTTPTGEESRRQYPLLQSFSPLGITKEQPEMVQHFQRLQESRREKLLETETKEGFKEDAKKTYEELKAMPKDEAAKEFDVLIKENPDLAKEIVNLVESEQRGLNYKDEFYLGLGVENGARAKAIKKDLDKLGTKEEKAAYYDELINKKVITKKVNEQLLKLLESK